VAGIAKSFSLSGIDILRQESRKGSSYTLLPCSFYIESPAVAHPSVSLHTFQNAAYASGPHKLSSGRYAGFSAFLCLFLSAPALGRTGLAFPRIIPVSGNMVFLCCSIRKHTVSLRSGRYLTSLLSLLIHSSFSSFRGHSSSYLFRISPLGPLQWSSGMPPLSLT